jgi:flagellar assembly protein FliH
MVNDNDNILKSGQVSSSAVPFQFDDVQALAKKMLQKANHQAQNIINAARKQAEDIEQAAYDDGFSKGREEGYAKGYPEGRQEGEAAARGEVAEHVATLADMLTQILQLLDGQRLLIKNQSEVDLLRLSFEIAKKIVKSELSVNPEIILKNVTEAIDLTVQRQDITIYVNPVDYTAVESYIPTLQKTFNDLGRVAVLTDDSVERGGCLAKNNEGVVDLQINQQINAVEQALLGVSSDDESAFAQVQEENAALPMQASVEDSSPADMVQTVHAEEVAPVQELYQEPVIKAETVTDAEAVVDVPEDVAEENVNLADGATLISRHAETENPEGEAKTELSEHGIAEHEGLAGGEGGSVDSAEIGEPSDAVVDTQDNGAQTEGEGIFKLDSVVDESASEDSAKGQSQDNENKKAENDVNGGNGAEDESGN